MVGALLDDDVTASVTVYVNVIDVNDNKPQFHADVTVDVMSLTASVSEDADVSTNVITVSATDRDSGSYHHHHHQQQQQQYRGV